MSGSPRVTVVVPIFNAERFLRECVESVLDQDCPEWELVLVDDGSTDASAAVAREFAASHPERIHFLHHEGGANRGSSASRNLGARQRRGELIAFLDADDVWPRHTLREMVEVMDRHSGTGFAYGRGQLWYSWSGGLDDPPEDQLPDPGVPLDQGLPPMRLLELMVPRKAMAPLMGALVVRHAVFDRVGGFEDAFTGMYDDQALVAKLNTVSASHAVDRVWLRYRQHPESMYTVARATGSRHESRRVYLEWLGRMLEERAPANTALADLVEAELAASLSDARKKGWRGRGFRFAKRFFGAVSPAGVRSRVLAWWRQVVGP